MLLTFSGISAITMLVLVANLCVHVQGAKSQMKSKSLIDSRKREVYIRSTVTKHKPVRPISNRVFSYGSVGSKNPHSAWRHDDVRKVVGDFTLKTGQSHSSVRSRRQNERNHNSKPRKTVSEKVPVHKTVNRNKRRAVSNYIPSSFQPSGILHNKKESALQNILLLQHLMKNHRNRFHTNQVKRRRVSLVNTGIADPNRFTNVRNHNFDPFHESTRNKIIPNFISSNPRDEYHSFASKVNPAEVYDQRLDNENYFPEPLNSRNFQPNTFDEIENSVARLATGENVPVNVNARQRLKHQARTYNQPPFHDYYEKPMGPDYRSFGSNDYDFEPENRYFIDENNNYPLKYQEEIPEDTIEQQNSPVEAGNEDENVNGEYVYQDGSKISHSILSEDNGADTQILEANAADGGDQYGEYDPQYLNTKLLPNNFGAIDQHDGKDKTKNFIQDDQFRPARTDPLEKNEYIEEDGNILLHPDIASEYEILNSANKTGIIESGPGKFDSNKAKEILKKILKDIQMTDEEDVSPKREEFVCQVNGSWVSEIGGVRLELSKCEDTHLKVKVDSTVPPRFNGLLCKDWKFTGSVPKNSEDSGLFTLSGYSVSQKKVGAFLGQCHSCGGQDTITGTWLIGKKARNCKDTHVTINEVRDVWRKELLNSLVIKHIQQRKHPISKCMGVTKTANTTTTTTTPAA